MKVLLIYIDISSWSALRLGRMGFSGWFSFGLGYIVTALKKANHTVSLYHIISFPKKHEFIALVKKEKPDLIGVNLNSNNFYYFPKLAKWLKEAGNSPIICGGPHPTLNPEEVISLNEVDMVCVGEAEAAVIELCNCIEKGADTTSIKNIWVKKGGALYKNPVRDLVVDLDSLGFPDRQAFNYERLELSKIGIGVFMASRGCPYACSYCCNHALMQIYGPKDYVRFRSVNHLLEEIKITTNKYRSLETILFEDNILPLDEGWFQEFCNKYREQIGKPFIINSSANFINAKTVPLLKDAGCIKVRIGVESGSEKIRREVLEKPISNQQIISAFKALRDAGIDAVSYNMLGIPSETPKDILETIKLNSLIKTKGTAAQICYPYQHTKLFALCRKSNLIKNGILPDINKGSIILNKNLSLRQIMLIQLCFLYIVKFYSMMGRLPGKFKKITIAISDFAISSKIIMSIMQPIVFILADMYRLAKLNIKKIIPKSSKIRLTVEIND